MSVRFIFGRSGAGKTSYCIEQIVRSLAGGSGDEKLIFLVPEQASYQAERSILSDSRVKGYSRLNVLSFDRLQFMLLGKSTAKSNLSQIGRQMVVQRLLYEKRDQLQVFCRSAHRAGTAAAIASTIKEFHQYGTDIDQIDEMVETMKKYDGVSLTTLKLSDIALIYKAYKDAIAGSFVDPDMQLNLAVKAVADSDMVKGAKLWVDGFAGFTSTELGILTELMQFSAETNIALCMDGKIATLKNADVRAVDTTSLFGMTQVTYCDLMEMTKKRKLKLQEPVILKETLRFRHSRALGHIEKNLFSEKLEKTQADESVKIAALSDTRSEVRYIAREILRLVKEDGYRFRDIAVITSDIDHYEHYLRSYLTDYEIPYFIDKREKLSQHCVVALINGALSIAVNGFSQSEILSYLKTNLTGVDSYDIDVLENYCIAYGIRDKDWTADAKWDFAAKEDGFDNKKIDKTRRTVTEPLVKFIEKLKAGDKLTAADFTKAVYEFLNELSVWDQLNEIVEQAISDGDNQKADLHRQFNDKFWDIFDEMTEAFGQMPLTVNAFSEVLKSAFSQITLAFIPPKLDQVLVGSIERSRHPELKAVFLLGCTEKQFPVPISYDSIINEGDRAAIQEKEFKLGPGLREQLANRKYLAYIAFTRPSDKLYITCPLTDSRGSEVVCSRFTDNLMELFTDLEIENVSGADSVIENISSKNELVELLSEKLGSDSDSDTEKLEGLFESIKNEKLFSDTVAKINRAINYDNKAVIEKDISKKLYRDEIWVSASKLNTIASCPFQYFSNYILKLAERKEFKFEPLDKGLFYHMVLEAVVKDLIKRKKDIAELEPQNLRVLVHDQIDRLLKGDSYISHFFTRSNHNAYIVDSMRQNLDDFIVAMAEMIKAGNFRPCFAEVKFGDKNSELGQCVIEMDNGKKVVLNGLIDRLDVMEIKGKKLAAVFDYKLSPRTFSYSKFYYGLDLQIPIYLLAIKSGNKSTYEPIGGFFVPVESAAQSTEFEKAESVSEKFSYKAKGVFNGEYFDNLDRQTSSGWSSYYNFGITKKDDQYGYYKSSGILNEQDYEKMIDLAREKIVELVIQMMAGKIDVSPYLLNGERPCTWCRFRSVCRFDWQINDYRSLQNQSKFSALGIEGDSNE